MAPPRPGPAGAARKKSPLLTGPGAVPEAVAATGLRRIVVDASTDIDVEAGRGAPLTDASYTCAGDTLTLGSSIAGGTATAVLHRG